MIRRPPPPLLLLLLLSLLSYDVLHADRIPIRINAGPSTQPSHSAAASQPISSSSLSSSPSFPSNLPRPPAPFALPPPLLRVLHVAETEEADERQRKPARGGAAEDNDGEGEVDLRFDEAYEEALWRGLDGACLSAIPSLSRYSYTLCPYHNITQQETKTSFQAVLGIWHSWELTPTLQLAMRYTDGTPCSQWGNRTALTVLHCSAPARSSVPLSISSAAEFGPPHLSRVLEPSRCSYELHFHTPLVCGLYQRVREEAAWRRWRRPKLPTSTISRIRQRSRARGKAEEEAIDAQEQENERRLLRWEMLSRIAAKNSSARAFDVRLRSMLNCVAALSGDASQTEEQSRLCGEFTAQSEPLEAAVTFSHDGEASVNI